MIARFNRSCAFRRAWDPWIEGSLDEEASGRSLGGVQGFFFRVERPWSESEVVEEPTTGQSVINDSSVSKVNRKKEGPRNDLGAMRKLSQQASASGGQVMEVV